MPLDRFDVSVVPNEPAALLADRANPDAPARWHMWDLRPQPGYAAAVVAEAPHGRLRLLHWSNSPTGTAGDGPELGWPAERPE